MKNLSRKLLAVAALLPMLISSDLGAQTYLDHFGAGHDQGITVSSSPAAAGTEASHSVDGTGLIPDEKGASRFLAQSTMGSDYEEIQYLTQIGIDAWLEEQFAMQGTGFSTMVEDIHNTAAAEISAQFGAEIVEEVNWGGFVNNLAFWQKVITEEDQLRQRVALALSEILVVSQAFNAVNEDKVLSHYYDLLYEGAFGNYRDLLHAVSLQPAMGLYLSHFNNYKTDLDENRRPDENYAREIMQLFTIGVHELNIDGTLRLDAYGQPIPTYDNEDIKEFSKIFTGLSGAAWDLIDFPQLAGTPVQFGYNYNRYDLTIPMVMYEEQHEPGPKYLLNNELVPAGQSGYQDIEDAIDHLFNHPNVGPFIGHKLILLLVKSNPSPEYISRVAAAFNNNGQGVRGDLQAVVKAIYTDPEARDCEWIDQYDSGRLREPILKAAHLFRAFNMANASGRYWFNDSYVLGAQQKQRFLASPTVFNFFSPSYAPAGLSALDLVGPEFEILDANTSIEYLNRIQASLRWKPMPILGTVDPNNYQFYAFDMSVEDEAEYDFSDEVLALQNGGTAGLIDRLDLILCHGQLSAGSRVIVQDMADTLDNLNWLTDQDVVEWTVYAIMLSPDYVVLR